MLFICASKTVKKSNYENILSVLGFTNMTKMCQLGSKPI